MVEKHKRLNSIIYHTVAIALAFIMIYPLVWMFCSSLKNNNDIFIDAYTLIPKRTDIIHNYAEGFKGIAGVPFGKFIWNTLVVAVIGTGGCVVSSIFAAYAFARVKFKGSGFWFTCVMITMMIPNQVMVVPQYIIFKKLHLLDTTISLIAPWFFGGAFFIFLIMQFIRGIPIELDEAAEIDGCSRFQTLIRILIPNITSAVITSVIFSFYWIWGDFFQPLIFMNTTRKFTVSLALKMFLDPTTKSNYASMFAMSVVSILPVIILFICLQKYLVEGVTATGLKG